VAQLLGVQKFLLYSKVSRPPLGPGQYIPVAVFPGVKQSGHEGDPSPACGVEIENNWSNIFIFVAYAGTS
jgi:hypothetical protein